MSTQLEAFVRAEALALRLDEIARDAGRLRRRFASNGAWTGLTILDRLADAVESLDTLTRPTAGELQRDYFAVCGKHELATSEALEAVDRRVAQLRWLLGREAA